MFWVFQYVHRRALLNEISLFHYDHTIGNLGHDAEIMCNEHHTHSFTLLNLAYELKDLRLCRDI